MTLPKALCVTPLALAMLLSAPVSAHAQASNQPPAANDDSGPAQSDSPVIVRRKNQDSEPPPPPPADEQIKNPKGLENFSLQVNAQLVTVDVSVLLDKNHQFVPGLQTTNFRVYEDGEEQKINDVRMVKTPITAVMLLEFAATNYSFIYDMRNTAAAFFHSLRPDDNIAVVTYDMRTHMLTDFTQNRDLLVEALNSLTVPGFRETNFFDALNETLDRCSRIPGHKYIIVVGSGRDTFSRITLDQTLRKIRSTPDVTIISVGTGQMARMLNEGRMGGMANITYLQADNQLRSFAQMTGGEAFFPVFEGGLPDVFSEINQSIRNQYELSYRPTNVALDGSYRKIHVELVDNEGKPLHMIDERNRNIKYSVIARDGYTAHLPVE